EMIRYYEKTVNAGDTIANRKFRHNILNEIIEPFCISRDSRRHFSNFEKEFLWHSSEDKTCKICNEKIVRFEDYQIDHIKAWDNGGETNLANAQLAHSSCNQSKGNK
ncbi:HNH endonuclease, partial [Crocinitomicaceae bacterium]|nr:HNH endonuclease [Crocinitomicaceae bacterium]